MCVLPGPLVLGKGFHNALTPIRVWMKLSHNVLNPAHVLV